MVPIPAPLQDCMVAVMSVVPNNCSFRDVLNDFNVQVEVIQKHESCADIHICGL
jgi:hypothetical protein